MDPSAQWLAGIFSALFAEVVKEAVRSGKGALGKALEGARGEEVKALHAALPLAVDTLKRDDPAGQRFVAFLEQKQQANDTTFGDALLRALLVEPQGVLSLTPNLQTQIPSDLQPLALKFLSQFHQQLWRQPPFDKLLAAKAAQDELRVVMQQLEKLREIAIDTKRGADALERAFPAPDLAAALDKYLEFVIGINCAFIRPWIIALAQDRPLKLDDIYVSLMLEREVLELSPRPTRNSEEKIVPINVAQAVKEHSRLAVKGDPGAGKSTLTRYLDLLFASAMWKQINENDPAASQVRDKQGNEYGQARLPIRIRIADYAEARKNNSTLSLREFLPSAFGESKVLGEVLKQVFFSALDEGNALILLDGLDEVAEENQRSQIGQAIEKFVNANSKNHFVVTSRKAGSMPLAGFVPFVFRALEQEQIGLVAGFWYLALYKAERENPARENDRVEDCLPRESLQLLLPQELHDSFRTDIEQFGKTFFGNVESNLGARRLIENPLTLTLLIELHLKGKPLAHSRSELYREILVNLLETWERYRRDIPSTRVVQVDDAEEMLGPLAYWLHESKSDASSNGTASEREIKAQLKPWADANNEKVSFLWQRLREQTPLFMEFARGQFGFAHRTFQEYFVAKELLRRKDETAELIYQHRHQPNWDEPILLALSSENDATELIRMAILAKSPKAEEKNLKSSDYDDVLHRDFFFAARCVADGARIDDVLQKEIGEQLIEWWYESGTWPGPMEPWASRNWESMEHAVRFTLINLRGTKVAEYIGGRFLKELVGLEQNLFERTNSALTRHSRFDFLRGPDNILEIWMPYRGLVLLGQECTPQVIKFFMRLMWSHHSFGFRIGEDTIKEMMKKKDAMLPALEGMLKDGEESKLYAAILLGEYEETTPEAVESLFDFLLEDDSSDEEQEDYKSNPDYESRDRRSRMRQRKKQMQDRALNALLRIEKPSSGYTLSDITPVLWTVIRTANERIESLFKAHAEELMIQDRFYRLKEILRPYDLNRLIAAFLLVKLDQSSEALNILQNAILKPISWELAKNSAKMLSSLGIVNEDLVAQALEWSRSKYRSLRWQAIELLGDLKKPSPEVFTRLFELLDDPEYGIPKEAAQTLLKIGEIPAEFLPQLLARIRHDEVTREDAYSRIYMVQILAEFRIAMPESTHREIAETLFALFPEENQDRSLLDDAEVVLGDLAVSPDVMPLLLHALKFGRYGLRVRVGWAIKQKFGIGHRVITNPDSPLAEWIYSKVEILPDTIKVLIDALRDDNSEVASVASAALSYTLNKPPELIDGLRALLQHPDPWARYRAMNRLLDFEYKENDVIETWLDLIKSDDDELRAEVAEKISRLPSTPEVADAVWSIAKNEKSFRVKAECYEYLLKVYGANDKVLNLLIPLLEDDADSHLTSEEKDKLEALPPEIQERMTLKMAARHALRELDELPSKIQAVLVRQTLSPNSAVRKDAIQSLRFRARLDSNLAGRLLALLDDNDGEVLQETCEVIGELFGKYPVGFMDERAAIAEKLYTMLKVKHVSPTLNPPVHFGFYDALLESPVPPPHASEEIPMDFPQPPQDSPIIPTEPNSPLPQVEPPADLKATTNEQEEHGFFGEGPWGALWAVAGTLATKN